MEKIEIFFVCISLTLVFSGCIDLPNGSCEFEQRLYADDWNTVIFTECNLSQLDDNKVETVFESILYGYGDIWIFTEDASEGWISYYNSRTINELTTINAEQTYNVNVEIDCVLRLG